MIAFELYLNGNKVATAGIDQGVMTIIANWVRSKQNGGDWQSGVSIAGLDTRKSENLKWFRQDLTLGDEVRIRLVDSERIDSPLQRDLK
jgi:hypothetical protein